LLDLLRSAPFRDRDAFADELLGLSSPPPDAPDLPRGAVPYIPCGVDEILAMAQDAPLGAHDTLVDLGAGLGRVVLLAHLLTGARAQGVEIQEALVTGARARCTELRLPDVSFQHGNAIDAQIDASVVFLHAPFNGQMLTQVLANLEQAARRRALVVCTVALELRDVPWLRPKPSSHVALSVYESR
jgi:SAM-dependent methyltransferase